MNQLCARALLLVLVMESSKRRVDICSPDKNDDKENDNESQNRIDWALCFICQEKTKDGMQDPYRNPSQSVTVEKRYDKIAQNIKKLTELDMLPVAMNIDVLKGETTLCKNLFNMKAVYHQKCKKKFDDDKVTRAENRAKKTDVDRIYRECIISCCWW